MPKVHYVKAARKSNPVANVGESYYWWKFRYGGKKYSKTPPKPSKLTQSDFLSQYYGIQEGVEVQSFDSVDDFDIYKEELIGELETLRDEQEEKFENMPESLQGGSTGDLIQGRIEGLEEWLDSIGQIEVDDDEDGEKVEQLLLDAVQELIDADPGID